MVGSRRLVGEAAWPGWFSRIAMLRPGWFFWESHGARVIPLQSCTAWFEPKRENLSMRSTRRANKRYQTVVKNMRKGSQARNSQTMFRFGSGGLHKSGNGEINWSMTKVYTCCCTWKILTAGYCLCVNSAPPGHDKNDLDLAGDGWKCSQKMWLVNSGKWCWKKSQMAK